ncbi:hypothetical protein [Phormidium sp. CCY1219]|jgi:plasmid maintenance system antidote protein VapI|uniref:hypothetical protein n=1 Tax=Phormidium sp. CCY1219 TaxID=2886104 RepID=UPI002D1EDFF8|nr:hypothetical protein [Phormidium sp. CCY1219]MEB3828106.1 hypothetical protein [Phormidium sp. CCY1219]
MKYTFDILGVSPILYFFNQQQEIINTDSGVGVEYLGTQKCTLDAFLESVESVSPAKEWDRDNVVETVIQFWLNNEDKIDYWKTRLDDAGNNNLLVARVADMDALRSTFESILGES